MDDCGYRADVPRFAAALRAIREDELGLNQRDFARRAGISQAQVSTYENGRETPTVEVLARIAERLGRDVKDLDPEGEAYTRSAPRRRLPDESDKAHTRRHARREVTMDDPRRYEFVSLFDALVRNPTAQEELVTMVRRFVARKMLGTG